MKAAIARRYAAVSRSLGHAAKHRLRQAVPRFQARTRGVHHPEIERQQALAIVKSSFPSAGPAELDAMAFYLVAASGMAELEPAKAAVAGKLDSLSEMGEMESLRLQMAMDRMSKMMYTLSNLLKKSSDNASTIAQNLK